MFFLLSTQAVSLLLLSLHGDIEHLVKPPLKISPLGAVAAQGERSLESLPG
jgi:hypothetical protein